MRFFFSPITFILELFAFAIQAAFLYGLALIAAITFLTWVIAQHPQTTTVTEYVTVPVTEYVTVPVAEVVEEIEIECLQIAGCRVFYENGKEICPDCVKK